MNKMITICLLLSGYSFAALDPAIKEVAVERALLTQVTPVTPEVPEGEYRYVLTMYKLINSSVHPSSFELCRVCSNEDCKEEGIWDCHKYFITKQKETLRCNTVRYKGGAFDSKLALIVDESLTNDSCDAAVLSDSDEQKTQWKVRTYSDGEMEKSFVGYPKPVHYF